MPDVEVTLTVNDDGTIDIKKFAENEHLAKVKGVIDGLRRESAGYRTRLSDLEPQVGRVEELEAQVANWSGKVAMTPEEKQAYDDAKAQLEKFKDLDPDDARAAITYRTTAEQTKGLRDAFKAAGYNPDVALGLDGVRSLETRVEQVEGKPQAQVKQGDTWRALDDGFLSERYSPFMSILKTEGQPKQPDAVVVLPQRQGGGEPTQKDPVKNTLDTIYGR
jgi:hypothetical protein